MKNKIHSLKEKLANGVSPAMATPLIAGSSRVNTAVIPELVDFLIGKGVSGLFVGGTTGEGIILPTGERKILHEATIDAVHGRIPVLVHVGALRTEIALELAGHASAVGADAVVAVTPIFYGMHDDALASFFKTIADAVPELPLFGYDIPQMAANGISASLAARLAKEIPSLAGLKSSNPNLQLVRALIDALPDDRILLAGNESAALGSLALGADGMISGLSTAIPEPFVALTRSFAAGDIHEARRQQRLINLLLANLPAGARLGGIKSILEARGIPVGPPLPPLPATDLAIWPAMRKLL